MNKPKFTRRNYEYETKCRRCGNLEAFHFADKDSLSILQFMNAIQDYIEHPRTNHCDKCNIETVQDVTAYCLPKFTTNN